MGVNELYEAFSSLPEPVEGLEEEVRRIYALSADSPEPSFPKFFEQDTLNYLVRWLVGTYEGIKAVRSLNGWPAQNVENNLLTSVISGLLAESRGCEIGLPEVLTVFRKIVPGEVDSATLTKFTKDLFSPIDAFSRFFYSGGTELQKYLDTHIVGLPKELKGKAAFQTFALGHLDMVLRFEAAMYSGLKEHYGVTV